MLNRYLLLALPLLILPLTSPRTSLRAAEKGPKIVSLILCKVEITRFEGIEEGPKVVSNTHFKCEVKLENETGKELKVRCG